MQHQFGGFFFIAQFYGLKHLAQSQPSFVAQLVVLGRRRNLGMAPTQYAGTGLQKWLLLQRPACRTCSRASRSDVSG